MQELYSEKRVAELVKASCFSQYTEAHGWQSLMQEDSIVRLVQKIVYEYEKELKLEGPRYYAKGIELGMW